MTSQQQPSQDTDLAEKLRQNMILYAQEADELKKAILSNEGDLNKNLYDLYNYALITPLRESIFKFLDDLLEQEESKHRDGSPLSQLYGELAVARYNIVSTKGLRDEVPKTQSCLQKAFDNGVEGIPLKTLQSSFQGCLDGMVWLAARPDRTPS